MTQLIINGIYMPEVKGNKYKAEEVPLNVTVEMISGRTVLEKRGKVWKITCAYNYIYDPTGTNLPNLLMTLRDGTPFSVVFLPDNGTELLSSTFIATSVTSPSMSFSANGLAYWTGLAFTLREVKPHA